MGREFGVSRRGGLAEEVVAFMADGFGFDVEAVAQVATELARIQGEIAQSRMSKNVTGTAIGCIDQSLDQLFISTARVQSGLRGDLQRLSASFNVLNVGQLAVDEASAARLATDMTKGK
jgi:hypothetical protein